MMVDKVIVLGGPLTGKSTLALTFQARGVPIFCGDPRSTVREAHRGVTYLPEGLPMAGDAGAAQWIVDNWIAMSGPWVCEGWIMARVLRRWLQRPQRNREPCQRIIVCRSAWADRSSRQEAMSKAVETVWCEVEREFRSVVEYR